MDKETIKQLLTDGVISNEVAAKYCPELKESDDERTWIINYLSNKELNSSIIAEKENLKKAIAWLEKQGQKPAIEMKTPEESLGIDSDKYNKIVDECIYDEQKPADKVEPKFKVGDWLVHKEMVGVTCCITQIHAPHYYLTYNNSFIKFIKFGEEDNYRPWTIQDAKDGDVLCCESGWTCIFKALNSDNISFSSYCFMDGTGWFCGTGSESHTLDKAFIKAYNGNIYPATKKQRDTLMKAMTDAGYTFDFEKKELKKIEYKHICELDNSYACVTFPFKAKVKSSGAIVTIHDGQLSPDGKEWIKYQSDAEDRYKVYEPNNLELVCEIERKPSWSEEDEKKLLCICAWIKDYPRIADFKDEMYTVANNYVDWLKFLKDRVLPQPKQDWKQENTQDLTDFENTMMHIGRSFFGEMAGLDPNDTNAIKEQANTLLGLVPRQEWSEDDEKKLLCICAWIKDYPRAADFKDEIVANNYVDWLKSLKPQNRWKPSDVQMEVLLSEANAWTKGCPKQKILKSLYDDLKKLREE